MNYYFTSESVTDGHPDKICDLISDTILDEILSKNPKSKVAIETAIKDDFILLYGETSFDGNINYASIAKEVLRKIGYTENYNVLTMIGKQSTEINRAVQNDKLTAGNQGIMFGYACDETDTFMPMPIYFAHRLTYSLKKLREKDHRFLPDGKSQVTVEYDELNPKRIESIVLSVMHVPSIEQNEIRKILKTMVIDTLIPKELLDKNTKIYINPSGIFTIGGSFVGSGTTGRKIVCDSYGGMARVGGGCFSSKDPTKVDRCAA